MSDDGLVWQELSICLICQVAQDPVSVIFNKYRPVGIAVITICMPCVQDIQYNPRKLLTRLKEGIDEGSEED